MSHSWQGSHIVSTELSKCGDVFKPTGVMRSDGRCNAMFRKRGAPIVQCAREFNRQELDEIQETVGLFPGLSRSELAATICEHLGWLTAAGGYKIDACLNLLEKLEAKGALELPGKREEQCVKRPPRSIALTPMTEPQPEIVGNLEDVGPVKVKVVKDGEMPAFWNEYVYRYHYLGYKKPFGCFMRYFVESARGLLGCLMFAGASKNVAGREQWIGWTKSQRVRNLAWVINNGRFVIFPWVQVKNLGSHVLGQVVRRVSKDYQKRWGYSPVVAETFVDPQYFDGTCYKAANWHYLGMTTGEGLARKGKTYSSSPKIIFVMPLVKNWRSLLCSEQLKGKVDQGRI